MTAQPGSPNDLWQRLGYTIERGPRKSRTIRRPDGSVVEIDKSRDHYAGELEAACLELSRKMSTGQQLDIFA
ncbi:hypothetical protein [Pseudomonas sp. T1.Ur]|uniref:hypothetical protein n=1 Tax=Pseudomonas sp. T1.Ur TaxID=2928704 RepID=UPI00201DEADE|nr:hypothetical protein [Pseudomonas sp. T1.Ur]MCL6701129.1 hypothetical protein [Pseudomonas sp. T1.Ur]